MSYSAISGAKVVVTGGAGFIGSNLCENLLRHGNAVICLDDFSTGKKKNIEPLFKQPRFTLIEGDIRNSTDCAKAMRGADIVLQQAALGSVPRSLKDPLNSNSVNVTGFLNVLIAARDAKVNRFVYAGSSSAYGDLNESPKKEDRRGQPLSPYAVTKIANELYAHVFGLNYSMEIIGLRYFNVFGRNQDPEGEYAAAIPRFIKAFISGRSPVIFGDGTNSRDFTYIENVIQMNHLAATTNNRAALGNVFNTAAGKSATLAELVRLLRKLLAKYDPSIEAVSIEHGPERQGDISHSLADISKARQLLGYAPSHDLEEGLKEAVDWYWKNYR
jgi:UDP-N-acetylglucosamine 4-epimerase